MPKRGKKPIIPPDDMPFEFVIGERKYRFYKNLKRDRKRYLIRLFLQNKEQILGKQLKGASQRAAIEEKPKFYSICLFKWDIKSGPMVIQKFPEEAQYELPLLMQIYASHKATNETGLFAMQSGENHERNYISYYDVNKKTENFQDELFLIIEADADFDPYQLEGKLGKILKVIMKYQEYQVESEKMGQILKSL